MSMVLKLVGIGVHKTIVYDHTVLPRSFLGHQHYWIIVRGFAWYINSSLDQWLQ